MEIRRDPAGYSLLDPKPASPSHGIYKTAPAGKPAERELNERRRRPDRRQRQQLLKGPDRRKKADRRRPKLLGSGRRLKPEQLEDRRGRLLDISV